MPPQSGLLAEGRLCGIRPWGVFHGAECQMEHACNAERIQRLCGEHAMQGYSRSTAADRTGADGRIYVFGPSHDVRGGLPGVCRPVWTADRRSLWHSDC